MSDRNAEAIEHFSTKLEVEAKVQRRHQHRWIPYRWDHSNNVYVKLLTIYCPTCEQLREVK